MTGIHPSVASHRLNILLSSRPVRQKVRRFHPDRQKIIRDEVDKLLEAGFIREMEYPDWLANVVVVPKKKGKWRVCVDYINLNNACPKDNFPLPRIDQITAFITPHGLYCYKVMPFRLKNVGATYQRLMTKIFKPLVGLTVEVYIDDIVVRHEAESVQMRFRRECWEIFGVHGQPKRDRSKLVALGHFIARFTDELQPFFLVLRKVNMTGWTDNCPSAFEKIKRYFTQPPVLSGPARRKVVSVVLFRCPIHKEQKLIYYVSRALADAETRYSNIEQTTLALQTHSVVILTDQPICNILHKPDLSGRMLQWAIELSEYGIEYQPRLSMKGQVMADFVVESSQKPAQDEEPRKEEWWTLRVDGASRSLRSGIGLLLQSPMGEQLEQAIRLGFPASNNEAEYEAILFGLDLALALSVSKLRVYNDSQLMVRHVLIPPSQKHPLAILLRRAKKRARSDGSHSKIPPDRIRVQVARFTLIGEHLYKRSFTGPYLRCLDRSEAQYILAELHEGVCGNHPGGQSLAHRAHSQGYYWPTMKRDVAAYVKKCDKCQRHAPIPHAPSETRTFTNRDCPEEIPARRHKLLQQMGRSRGICQHQGQGCHQICVEEHHLLNLYSTPNYPQSNGQAEATNKTLVTALKKRLEQAKGKWVEELPGVLWAYRTTPGRPTGNSPFALAYGMDASDESTELGRNLDWADEVRENASIWMTDYQQRAPLTIIARHNPESSRSERWSSERDKIRANRLKRSVFPFLMV
uniref:Uncharacterized protein n=1 Tax=Vitis vinifera TaxID=29760 RepID=A5BKA8_VITVI|nr:hypothetical protein VITISV_005681 [Vitis vinifera]